MTWKYASEPKSQGFTYLRAVLSFVDIRKSLNAALVASALLCPVPLSAQHSLPAQRFVPSSDIVPFSAAVVPVPGQAVPANLPSQKPQWNCIWRRVGGIAAVSLPAMALGGVAASDADGGLKGLRDSRMPSFSTHLDDYLQFSPGAVMLALKTAGVRGRSSWAEMLTASSAAYVIMGGSVKSLKMIVSAERPDGSDARSFPSGHSARAFMMAALLTREYGELSPWVGAGAYSVAAATGVMRIAGDRHWLSDVLTGAGLGVLSAEAGYLISDLVFGKLRQDELLSDELRSSFIGIYTGTGWLFGGASGRSSLRSSHIGLEGAYFFNGSFGLGGRALLSYDADSFSRTAGSVPAASSSSLSAASADFASVCAGLYYRWPLGRRIGLGSKALAGYFRQTASSSASASSVSSLSSVSSASSVSSVSIISAVSTASASARGLKTSTSGSDVRQGLNGPDLGEGLDLCAGLSLDIRLRDSYGLRLFADCDYLPCSYAVLLTLGFSFNLLLR